MTTYPLKSIIVDISGYTSVVVTFTDPTGATPTVHSDAFGVTPISLPDTITATTKFFMPHNGPWTVSAKVSGIEMAGGTTTGGGTISLGPPGNTPFGTAEHTFAPGNAAPPGAYVPVAVVSGDTTGATDTTNINLLLSVGPCKLKPGGTYYITSLVGSYRLDATDATIIQVADSNSNLWQNKAVSNPSGTAADGAMTSGSNVLTTALGASAVVGQSVVVGTYGAGPSAGNGGNSPLCGIVASATTTTITINKLGTGAACPAIMVCLAQPLSTSGAITALPVRPLPVAITAGSVTLTFKTTTQTFTTTGAAAGATSIPITSATPNYPYPPTTVIAAPGASVSSQAVNLYNRDSHAAVVGGYWNMGANNAAPFIEFNAYGFRCRHADNPVIDIQGFTSPAFTKEAINIGDVNGGYSAIRSATASSGGIQLIGPVFGHSIPLIAGSYQDDVCAPFVADWPANNDMSGDLTGITVGKIDATTTTKLLRVLSGPGLNIHSVNVTDGVYGSAGAFVVEVGDETTSGKVQLIGGSFGTVDCGFVDAATVDTLVNIVSPTADRIRLRIRDDLARASGTPVCVNISGSSTCTIGVLELTECDWPVATTTTSQVVNLNGAGITIGHLLFDKCSMTTSGVNFDLLDVILGTVNLLTLRDHCRSSTSSSGNDLLVTGGTVNLMTVEGGYLTSGGSVARCGVSGTLGTVSLLGTYASGYSRIAQSQAGTLTVLLANPTFSNIVSGLFFANGASLVVKGGVTLIGSQPLVQRAASESVRVVGPFLPADASILTPAADDQLVNTNASSLYGGANCTLIYDNTYWRAVRGYLGAHTVTLVAGTVAVADTNITANSSVKISLRTAGGTVGAPYVSALTPGTGFTVTSTSPSDTSTLICEVARY